MTGNYSRLTPELWQLVGSSLNRFDILSLTMSSGYLARIFALEIYTNWEVSCCINGRKTAQTNLDDVTYCVGLDGFFDALKYGGAPAFAEKVTFSFCRHRKPVKSIYRRRIYGYGYTDDEDDSEWPVEKRTMLFNLLNASEIIVSARRVDETLPHICNKSLFEDILRHYVVTDSPPTKTVKLRMYDVGSGQADDNSYYKTICDPSLQSTIGANMQLALGALNTLRVEDMPGETWDEFDGIRKPEGWFPNVKHLTLRRGFAREHEYSSFPHCRQLCMKRMRFLNDLPLCYHQGYCTFYYFDDTPRGRSLTKISVHTTFHQWDIPSDCELKELKVLEFHILDDLCTRHLNLKAGFAATIPRKVNRFLWLSLGSLPNLEVMTFKFNLKTINLMDHSELLIPGQVLSTGFCERCKERVQVIETDVKVARNHLPPLNEVRRPDHQFSLIADQLDRMPYFQRPIQSFFERA